jgi:hypothetical protein
VLHWIKSTSQEDTLTRAIEQVDAQALAEALKNGQIQVNKRA